MILRAFSNVLSKFKTYKVGDQVTVTRKITKEDVEDFKRISGDTNPIHSSEDAIVHGAFLNSIVSGVIGTKLPGPGAMVAQQILNFPNKCFVGETVQITVRLTEDRKIVKVDFSCVAKNTDKIVLYGNAKLVMSKNK